MSGMEDQEVYLRTLLRRVVRASRRLPAVEGMLVVEFEATAALEKESGAPGSYLRALEVYFESVTSVDHWSRCFQAANGSRCACEGDCPHHAAYEDVMRVKGHD